MAIQAGELRAGTIFEDKDDLYKVLEYQHKKLARSGATVKVKVRNLRTGTIKRLTFAPDDRLEQAYVEKKDVQFLYRADDRLYFMDSDSYEQFAVSADVVGDESKYLYEGMEIALLFYGDEPLDLILPITHTYEVIEAPPGMKGDSATNVFKGVTVEAGFDVRAPLFIERGDRIVVDLRSGEYVERAS